MADAQTSYEPRVGAAESEVGGGAAGVPLDVENGSEWKGAVEGELGGLAAGHKAFPA